MRPGRRLRAIDRVRGGAALAVAWFHLTNAYGGPVGVSGSLGWLGVDCFFVVSGFVIPLSLHRIGYTIGRFPAFMARRLVRLEPPYLVSIVVVVALHYASALAPGFGGRGPDYAAAQVALHLLYLIPFSDHAWISPVYWSLAYEFAFYGLAGLLFPVLWRRPVGLTVVLICAASVLVEAAGSDPPRIPLFLMGVAAARHRLGHDSRRAFGLCLACAAAVMAAERGLLAGSLSGDASLSAAAGCATALLASAGTATGRRPPWLGRISYSLYLTHVPVGGRVVNLGRRFVEGPVQECLLSLVALGVCLAFAEAFHRLFERPSARLSGRVPLGDGGADAARRPAP